MMQTDQKPNSLYCELCRESVRAVKLPGHVIEKHSTVHLRCPVNGCNHVIEALHQLAFSGISAHLREDHSGKALTDRERGDLAEQKRGARKQADLLFKHCFSQASKGPAVAQPPPKFHGPSVIVASVDKRASLPPASAKPVSVITQPSMKFHGPSVIVPSVDKKASLPPASAKPVSVITQPPPKFYGPGAIVPSANPSQSLPSASAKPISVVTQLPMRFRGPSAIVPSANPSHSLPSASAKSVSAITQPSMKFHGPSVIVPSANPSHSLPSASAKPISAVTQPSMRFHGPSAIVSTQSLPSASAKPISVVSQPPPKFHGPNAIVPSVDKKASLPSASAKPVPVVTQPSMKPPGPPAAYLEPSPGVTSRSTLTSIPLSVRSESSVRPVAGSACKMCGRLVPFHERWRHVEEEHTRISLSCPYRSSRHEECRFVVLLALYSKAYHAYNAHMESAHGGYLVAPHHPCGVIADHSEQWERTKSALSQDHHECFPPSTDEAEKSRGARRRRTRLVSDTNSDAEERNPDAGKRRRG